MCLGPLPVRKALLLLFTIMCSTNTYRNRTIAMRYYGSSSYHSSTLKYGFIMGFIYIKY